MSGRIAAFKSKVLSSSRAIVQKAFTERLNTEWGQSTKSINAAGLSGHHSTGIDGPHGKIKLKHYNRGSLLGRQHRSIF